MIPEASTLPRPPFFWPGLLVALPLLILSGLAAVGLRSRWQARMAEAQEEAQRVVERQGREVARRLESATSRLQPVRFYPAVPVPPSQISAAWEQAVEAGDVAAFRSLREASEPAWTAAGLPVAALAAWEVYHREPTPENAGALVEGGIHLWPSMISPVILTKATDVARRAGAVPESLSGSQQAWLASEEKRALIQRHPGPAEGGQWISENGGLWLIQRQADEVAVAAGPDLKDLSIPAGANGIPAWMQLTLWHGGRELFPDGNPPGEPLRVLAEYPGLVNLRAVLADPDALYASLKEETIWAAGLIGAATLAAGSGLWLSRRALLREQRLHALKSQFVASVSHELRAPIGSVRLMAEALATGTVEGEAAHTFHRLLVQEGVRLSALIENVLDFARMESGHKIYQREETDLPALCRDTVALLEPRAEPRGIQLLVECGSLGQVPQVDALAIQQALMNLLDNALKFSPEGGVISVVLAEEGTEGWSLAVSDEGPGIPSEEHVRIFERFTRLGNELRRETQGAGIGLSLVKHITDGHRGRISVENLTPRGTRFTLNFPWHYAT